MLIIGLISLLLAIGLGVTRSNTHYSSTIPSTLLMRMTSIILIFGALLSFNALYVQAIGSGLGLYSGLFHVTSVTQAIEIFIFAVGAFILLPESVLADVVNIAEVPSAKSTISSAQEYPIIILFTTIGASFLISSSDLVSMYLSIELQSFAVYILAAINRNSESATSAGLKYFLLGALSSALILLGSSLIYAYTGLTSFEGIYMLQNTASHELGNNTEETITVASGVVIIGVGFLFKVAAAPFHSWAPDVYDGVPTIVTTWLTVMPKISIFVFLLSADLLNYDFMINQDVIVDFAEVIVEVPSTTSAIIGDVAEGTSAITSTTSGETNEVWKTLLLTTSLLSLVIGTVVGLAQYRLKRLLAYSTISHVGFLLLALCVNSEKSTQSFLFYLMQYSITNLNAFLVVLALGYISSQLPYFRTSPGNPIRLSLPESNSVRYLGSAVNAKESTSSDITLISQLKGEFHTNPALSISLAICLFSMAGIPPLLGFFAKYLVLYSAIENGYYFLALMGILASVVSAVYYLRIIRVVFINTTLPERHLDKNNNLLINSVNHKLYLGKNNNALENKKSSFNGENSSSQRPYFRTRSVNTITNTHSYLIAVFTLFITVYILSPSLFLNCSNLLALSLFTA